MTKSTDYTCKKCQTRYILAGMRYARSSISPTSRIGQVGVFKLAQFLSLMPEVSAPLMNDDAGIVVWAHIHRSN